jgi:hypothetical protein
MQLLPEELTSRFLLLKIDTTFRSNSKLAVVQVDHLIGKCPSVMHSFKRVRHDRSSVARSTAPTAVERERERERLQWTRSELRKRTPDGVSLNVRVSATMSSWLCPGSNVKAYSKQIRKTPGALATNFMFSIEDCVWTNRFDAIHQRCFLESFKASSHQFLNSSPARKQKQYFVERL